MKTSELLDQLNAAIADLANTRVNHFSALHESVRYRVDPLLEPHGLHYDTWSVVEHESYAALLKLEIEFTDDAGWKTNRRGRLHSATFSQIGPAETIDDLKLAAKVAEIQRRITEIDSGIESSERDIERLKVNRVRLIGEIQALKDAHQRIEALP